MDIIRYCLDNLPKNYESTFLLKELKQGESGCVAVKILDSKWRRNILFVESFSELFSQRIHIIIFNAKPYHYQIFSINKNLNVLGSIDIRFNNFSNNKEITLVNPKVVSQINIINTVFKKRGVRLSNVQKNVSLEALEQTQIPKKYIDLIYRIFHPDYDFFQEFIKIKNYPPQYLEAIKFCEIFLYLKRLKGKKIRFDSKFQCRGEISEFVESLPFTLTNAQREAISTIKKDLGSKKAARRIVMGDVGCGKTMVILASVLIAYPQKSMLMAPTSILARQLYNEAKKFLPTYIRTTCITSPNNRHDKILQDTLIKDSHFIIGTQALLFKSSDFSDFALVMTDEQHRFGTGTRLYLEKMLESKQDIESINAEFAGVLDSLYSLESAVLDGGSLKLDSNCFVLDGESKDLRRDFINSESSPLMQNKKSRVKKPHNLQFSATPIPRTMSMMQSNFIDFTFIKDLPFEKNIDTNIISKEHFSALLKHIKSEIAKGNQVAIIYPKVEKSEDGDGEDSKSLKIPYMSLKQAQDYWQRNFKNVFVTHGRDVQKESILESFAKSGGSILLATTMIEVGISLPRLNIIVIVGAERLGLATLHQLRGRVSRNGVKGYCYLYTHNLQNERLGEFAKTTSGFDIAELDLKYRNAGDLLDGRVQSGKQFEHFDLAMDLKILKEAQESLDK